MVGTEDRGSTLRRERGQDQRGTRPQVADLHFGTVQPAGPDDLGVVIVDQADVRTHASQLGQPLQAVLEHGLVDA